MSPVKPLTVGEVYITVLLVRTLVPKSGKTFFEPPA
jgi:hypothetical protein